MKVVAYHGSSRPVRRFDPEVSTYGVMWFSGDRAKILAGESGAAAVTWLMTVELDVDKVAGWPEYDSLMLQQINDLGYDSIHLDDVDDWIMFDPDRIRVLKVERVRPGMREPAKSRDDFRRYIAPAGSKRLIVSGRAYADVEEIPLANIYVLHHSVNPVDARLVEILAAADPKEIPPVLGWRDRPELSPREFVKLIPGRLRAGHPKVYVHDGTHRARAAAVRGDRTLRVAFRWHRVEGDVDVWDGVAHPWVLPPWVKS